ncbi:hypothetical protein [Gulosibacter faecalis]|uniref:Uncharacterized protein n=1 Tax=Gulosibacter faecalis TaxID=272240 RepID=A0ABW5V3G8_9MICO|nr:hypothetical protein [Gulosibacter faecalis]
MGLALDALLEPPLAEERVTSIDVDVNGVAIPVALAPREGATKIAVFYNGAIARKLAPTGRVFQRSTWAEDVNAHCLYICDPALYNSAGGSIAWGQVDETNWAGNLYVQVVEAAGELLGVPASNRLHYGSSAGGFQAMVTAAADKGSIALVNNPQTDWTKYNIGHAVRRTLDHSFSSRSTEEVVESFDFRARVWAWFEKLRHVPRFTYLLNAASANDLNIMHRELNDNLVKMQHEFTSAQWTTHIYYNEAQGHNPAPRPTTLQWINAQLATLN